MNFHKYNEEKISQFKEIQLNISDKKYEQAIEFIENTDNNDPLFIMAEAQCYMRLNKIEEAKNLYNKAITSCDKLLSEKTDTFILNIKGNCNLMLKKYIDSIECYNKILRLDNDNAIALCFKSVALLRLNETEAAYECLSRLLEIETDNYDIMLFKAHYLNEIGRYDDSIKLTDKILNAINHPQAYLLKADSLFEKGKTKDALTNIKKSLELDSNNSYSWYLKAEIEMDDGNYKQALNDFKNALSINDKIDCYWFDMGSCYLNLSNYKKAFESYEKAFELNPHSGGIMNSKTFLNFIKNIGIIGKNLNFYE